MADPTHLYPAPSPNFNIMAADEDNEGIPIDELVLGSRTGSIFYDGSCARPKVRSLARAAFAAAEYDEHGAMMAVMMGAVPAYLPQTPQAA